MCIKTSAAPMLPAPTMLSNVPYWLSSAEDSMPPCASAATVPMTKAVQLLLAVGLLTCSLHAYRLH